MAFPVNTLEVTLSSARAGEASPEQLLEALAGNPLWVPLPAGADRDGNAPLPVLLIEDRPYVAAYTSDEQLNRATENQAHMVLPGRELAGLMAAELGLAINPGAELGLPVNPEGVRRMRGGTVPAGTRMRLGEPAEEPVALLDALRAAFALTPAVVQARRALAQVGDEPAVLLIGVRPEPAVPDARDTALAAVRGSVAGAPVPYPVEAVFLDDPDDPVTAWMLRNTEPFYEATGPTP